jgi:uncharacterized protein YbaP (TraB family)
LISFFLLLFVSPVARGQSASEKSMLWEISGKGLSKPSFLFGTIHAICAEDLVVTEAIRSRISASQQLYLELDMDDPGMFANMQQMMLMQDGTTLKSLLSEDEYKLVNTYFTDSLGMPLALLNTVKPFFLTSMMLPSVLNCQPASWETSLTQLAQAKGTEVKGLETVGEQLAFFDKIPYKDQAAMLVESLKDSGKSKEEFRAMVDLYKQGDIEGIQKLITDQSAGIGKYDQLLVTERNNHWVPVIRKAAGEKPTFFAVGAGHLGGTNGLIRLLRKAGYKVKPVVGG